MQPRLGRLAAIAGQLLAVFGLVSAIFAVGSWLFRRAYLLDVAAIVRPTCERHIIPPSASDAVPADGSWREIGVTIYAVSAVRSARLQLHGVEEVASWGVYGEGLSSGELRALKDTLQASVMGHDATTPELPTLAPTAKLQLVALARPQLGVEPCDEQVPATLLLLEGKVQYLDASYRAGVGSPSFSVSPVSFVVTYLVLVGIGGYFLYVRPKRSKARAT